jgi:hypothetical protein
MHTSGGRVSVTINGINYSARGTITIAASNATAESGVNQDGSLYRLMKPKARTAELTFDRFVSIDGDLIVWDESVLAATNFGCTFIEQDTNRTHLISGAFFVGDPQMDTSTGEVSGLSLAGDAYKNIVS